MNVKVTVEFMVNNICSKQDLKDSKMTLEEMTDYIINEEGLLGVTEEGKIVKCEEIK